jgi:hypothetical protein
MEEVHYRVKLARRACLRQLANLPDRVQPDIVDVVQQLFEVFRPVPPAPSWGGDQAAWTSVVLGLVAGYEAQAAGKFNSPS